MIHDMITFIIWGFIGIVQISCTENIRKFYYFIVWIMLMVQLLENLILHL